MTAKARRGGKIWTTRHTARWGGKIEILEGRQTLFRRQYVPGKLFGGHEKVLGAKFSQQYVRGNGDLFFGGNVEWPLLGGLF